MLQKLRLVKNFSIGDRWGGLLAAVVLCLGFIATTRLAGAQPEAMGDPDLAALLEDRLDDDLGRPASASKATAAAAAPTTDPGGRPIEVAVRMALAALLVSLVIFAVALWVKRGRDGRVADGLGSNLAVKDSVWIGRGQRIILLTFENHKVLVGVSGGTIHSLGTFGEEGEAIPPNSPIEREAARLDIDKVEKDSDFDSDFAEFVKGELAASLGNGRDRRRKMIKELNSL